MQCLTEEEKRENGVREGTKERKVERVTRCEKPAAGEKNREKENESKADKCAV